MGVIGRLDEQVDAILITPLRRTDETKRDEHGAAEQDAPTRPLAQLPAQHKEPDAQRATDDLPVWLL